MQNKWNFSAVGWLIGYFVVLYPLNYALNGDLFNGLIGGIIGVTGAIIILLLKRRLQ